MIKRALWAGFVGVALSVSPPALAFTVQEVPNPRQQGGWVTDMADILTPATEAQINQLITQLEAKNGSEIAVVTVDTTAPAPSPKVFATTLFNYWGIGKSRQNNGVLFLISVSDRRTEIETGYGIEPILPDARVGRLLDQHVIPRFKQGDYDGGILHGTQALVTALEGDAYNPVLTPVTDSPVYIRLIALGGLIVGAIALRNMTKMAQRPVAIQPEGYYRQPGTDPHDRGVQLVVAAGSTGSVVGISILIGMLADASWVLVSSGAGVGSLVLYLILLRVIDKDKSSRSIRPLCCATCQQPMQPVKQATVRDSLSHPEQVAWKLGSVVFEGWQCPTCHPQPPMPPAQRAHRGQLAEFHLRAYEIGAGYSKCPRCQELTVSRSEKTLVHATERQTGLRLISHDCQCCPYHSEQQQIIPRVSSSSSSSGSSGSSGGGGGSFGGGSSGGGGAGRSW